MVDMGYYVNNYSNPIELIHRHIMTFDSGTPIPSNTVNKAMWPSNWEMMSSQDWVDFINKHLQDIEDFQNMIAVRRLDSNGFVLEPYHTGDLVPSSLSPVGYTIVPKGYEEPLPGTGVAFVTLPNPLDYTFLNNLNFNPDRYGYIDETFENNVYKEPWVDGGNDPGGYGESVFENENLKIVWGNVPYAFKKTLTGSNNFGDGLVEGTPAYIKDLVIEVGQLGVISEHILDSYDPEDPRYGSWIPDEVYFGIHIQGLTPSKALYIVFAYAGAYEADFDENNSKEIVGPDITTKLVLSTRNVELIELRQYTSWLGGGATDVSIVGPSGVGEDGNFNPTVFGDIPLPQTPWDYTEITDTGKAVNLGYSIESITIGENGSKLYISDGDVLYQYDMVDGDITTLTLTGQLSFSGTNISFKPDGTAFYSFSDPGIRLRIQAYQLSSPWNIGTASLVSDMETQLYVGSNGAEITALFFRPDGECLYLMDKHYSNPGAFVVYPSTPWSIGNPSDYDNMTKYSMFNRYSYDQKFDPMGRNLFFLTTGSIGSYIRRYPLSTPWDFNTIGYNIQLDGMGPSDPISIYSFSFDIHPNGRFLYADSDCQETLRQFAVT